MPRFLIAAIAGLAVRVAPLAAQAAPDDKRVVLVTIDGVRWQEVFAGADSTILADTVLTPDAGASRTRFWRNGAEARRATLLPFLWSTVVQQGQIFGNRYGGGSMQVTNGHKFSYPGYNEMLTGRPDARIDSNDKVPNPNVTVFEWLHGRPGFAGKVAAFATWDVFPFILNEPRSGVPVNAGWEPIALPRVPDRQEILNRLTATLYREWEAERWDALTYAAARDYLLTEEPRVLYVALGETDDWAHEHRYDRYLEAARRSDAMIRELWETLQADPRYRNRTSLIVTTDHGRGASRADWSDHGKDVPDAEYVWAAVLGPGFPAAGLRDDVTDATQGQIAATVAWAVGQDFKASRPGVPGPLGSK